MQTSTYLTPKAAKGTVYLDDDVLPHYTYFERNNNEVTAKGRYLNSDDSYMSNDNGHGECGRETTTVDGTTLRDSTWPRRKRVI